MLKFIRLLPLLPLRSAFRTSATIGAEKKFCSSGTVGGTAEARSNRSPRASASRLYFSQARLPRQFSSVTKMAANVARTASPISPQRSSRQRNLVLGLSFINQTVAISDFSVRGLGAKFRGRSASGGAERSASSSFTQRCWACTLIIISPDRTGLPVTLLTLSRWEKFTMKSKSQTAASPVQIRRHGKTSSQQKVLKPPSNKETKAANLLCSLVSWLFNSRTTSRRIASSFGTAVWWWANKRSRGVFINCFLTQRRKGAETQRIEIVSSIAALRLCAFALNFYLSFCSSSFLKARLA